jgi:long-chain fatty acid transport protein
MKFRARKLIAGLGIAAALCGWSSTAEALLAGIKVTGMAATTTAYPQDSFVAAYNPAGLAFIENRVDMGAAWDQTGQYATIVGNDNPAVNGSYSGDRTKDTYLAEFGFKRDIGCNLSAGLVLYNRNFVKTTYNTAFPLFGTSNLGLEYLNETLAPSIAWRFWNNHSIGLSVNFQFQRVKNNGLERLDIGLPPPLPGFTVAPGFLTCNNYNWSSGVGVTIGYYGRLFCDKLGIGCAYTPRTYMQHFRRYRGFFANGGQFDLPQRLIAGFAYKWIPCSTIAFDVEWVDWAQITALSNPLRVTEGFFEEESRLGGTHGTGFGFKSQTFYRVGIDYRFGNFTVRTGYRYANAPIDRDQTATNILLLDTVKQFWTVGGTYEFDCQNEISFFYAIGFKNKINGQNSIPEGSSPDINTPPSTWGFGGGEANISQQKRVLGISLGHKF